MVKRGEAIYEITMNPKFLSEAEDKEICKKLVEVMTLLWQYEYGTPSRRGYYNKEYADKLASIGLMPSSTGKEGDKKSRQKMDAYPMSKGTFMKVYRKIRQSWLFPFRMKEQEKVLLIAPSKNMNKTTYRCSCGVTIWGRQNLPPIECKSCMTLFEKVGKK